MHVLIVGAGIGGLSAALSMHAVGIDVSVIDCVTTLRPLGVGINLLPHAVRELTEMGLGDELAASGIATAEMVHFDRYGHRIWGCACGRDAGYHWPQYSIHRGELQMILLGAVRSRLGPDAVRTGITFVSFEQPGGSSSRRGGSSSRRGGSSSRRGGSSSRRGGSSEPPAGGGVMALVRDETTGEIASLHADVLVGADGLYSRVRAQLHPDEPPPRWSGIKLWRGVTPGAPFLSGRTVAVSGTNAARKFVAYPISRKAELRGDALINWVAEVMIPDGGGPAGTDAGRTGEARTGGSRTGAGRADWNRAGLVEDVLPWFAGWTFDWLDIPALINDAEQVLEYPMVDRDPLPSWGCGRVTLLGDAAHPMYPIGANGGSQAVVDARVLAYALATAQASGAPPEEALAAYEDERREKVNAIVLACRDMPADRMLQMVSVRAPDGFDQITDVLSAAELAAFDDAYRETTLPDVAALNARPPLIP